MSAMLAFTLERDGHDQPWGFRLQGGSDVGMPLSVQRVLVGTPAENSLKKADVIVKISQTDAKGMTHQGAADIFNNAGNQITIIVKRAGVVVSGVSQQQQQQHQHTVNGPSGLELEPPVSGGIALPGLATVTTAKADRLLAGPFLPSDLERNHKDLSSNFNQTLSLRNQPYRTMPIIQPSPKVQEQLGPGSTIHLKMQGDHICGIKEPVLITQSQINREKANELLMKQKVAGTLQQIQNQQTQQSLSSVTNNSSSQLAANSFSEQVQLQQTVSQSVTQNQTQFTQVTNSEEYSEESIKESVMQQASPLINPASASLQSSGSTLAPGNNVASSASKLRPSTPTKSQQVVLTPTKEFNPQESATWKALQENDPKPVDPEKIKNYTAMKEHDPVFAEVYQAPTLDELNDRKSREPSVSRLSPNLSIQRGRSPVAEFLPFNRGGKPNIPAEARQMEGARQSPVRHAAHADSGPVNHQLTNKAVKIPMFETNSIGGRKRITQSASFNKLMSDVLGE